MNPCFVLFTDFSREGPYVGLLHSVVRNQLPGAGIVDLQHDLPPFRPRGAGLLLRAMTPWLPEQAMVVAVVDPGVGTSRRGLVLEVDGRVFVGPDNGLFAPLFSRATRISTIEWKPDAVANTFHGRDWFVPAALRLAVGGEVSGPPIGAEDCVGHDWPDELAEIIYVDAFGNLVTGILGEGRDRSGMLESAGCVLEYAETFAQVAPGAAFWYVNSLGLVELAVNQGSAAALLGLQVGDRVPAFG